MKKNSLSCNGSEINEYFLLGQESAGESFYMLFRAIKHQVDKGPVDAVTGKAKYTLNDNRLLREDVEYRTLVRTPGSYSSLHHVCLRNFMFLRFLVSRVVLCKNGFYKIR